jgi:hypothetical protein
MRPAVTTSDDQNSLFSANVALFRGPEQASSSEIKGGQDQDPVRERVKSTHGLHNTLPATLGSLAATTV